MASSPDQLMPLVVAAGRLGFGPSSGRFVRCLDEDGLSGVAQFASSVSFVVAEFQSGDDEQRIVQQPLLIKHNMPDKAVRDWLKLDYQFCNEVLSYEEVLPFLGDVIGGRETINSTFPRYFYGAATLNDDPENFVIVLEDLRSSGYVMCPQVLDLDFEHCALAFRKLGAFHALSYAAKKSSTKKVLEVAKSLIETRLFEDSKEDGDYLFTGSVARAAKPLLEKQKFVKEIEQFQNRIQDSLKYMAGLLAVDEPMSVFCHGDFCRNNVLYKYENGNPVDVKFFDLAHMRYASPMMDFSFFYQLNCSETLRKHHKEDFLRIYHEALSSTIPGLEVPSLEDFKEEFRRKAVYGFLHCSFFKPAMMDPVPFNPAEEVKKKAEQKGDRVLRNGGEAATMVIAALLQELLEANCTL